MKSEFYVTRNTTLPKIVVYPAHIGIRKFHGCVQYGAASSSFQARQIFGKNGWGMWLDFSDCKYIFGFVPKPGEAWLVEGNKRTKVDIEFTL